VDVGSQNMQYFAQISHRFYPKKNMTKVMLMSSLGIEQRHFKVDSNNSIGSLSYMAQYIALDLKIIQDQFTLHFLTRSGFLGSASQAFQNVQDFTSSSGLFFDFSLKLVKEVSQKFDLNLLTGIRRDKLSLNNENANVNDINLAIGLTYHWCER
jgi:hypothetical protein